MFSIELHSIQQDQLTGKDCFAFLESTYNDMDHSLVIIQKGSDDTCIGYRIHKLLILSTTKCGLVYPKLDPNVIVKYGILKESFSTQPKEVKAKTSKNPEGCGDLVFIEVSVSKQNKRF